MFRLFLDVPLGDNEVDAIIRANDFLNHIRESMTNGNIIGCPATNEILKNELQFRLGCDGDRGNRNYMNKDEFGHASTKKLKVI